jgi:hypothetical protein
MATHKVAIWVLLDAFSQVLENCEQKVEQKGLICFFPRKDVHVNLGPSEVCTLKDIKTKASTWPSDHRKDA